VFVLRTCALWKYNRFVLIVILTFSLASMIAIASTGYHSHSLSIFTDKTSTIPGITGCYTSYNLFVPFLLLFIIELGLMSLTLTHAIQSWWMASGLYQFIILAILTLRMHLHLWQVDQQVHNMDALVCISLSDV
ncbi:hypothetical protein BDR07DRAFT_1440545, partial [Suillus spraguei]